MDLKSQQDCASYWKQKTASLERGCSMLYLYALIAVIVIVMFENNDPSNWTPEAKEGNIKAGVFLYALMCIIIYMA